MFNAILKAGQILPWLTSYQRPVIILQKRLHHYKTVAINIVVINSKTIICYALASHWALEASSTIKWLCLEAETNGSFSCVPHHITGYEKQCNAWNIPWELHIIRVHQLPSVSPSPLSLKKSTTTVPPHSHQFY